MALNKASAALHVVKQPRPGGSDSYSESYWAPNTDVYVTEAGLVITVELAGMRREHLELSADGNRLTIAGQRRDDSRAPKCTFLVMEISYGAFESIIELPPGYNLSEARASYHNGFLRIEVPEHIEGTQKAVPLSVDSEEN